MREIITDTIKSVVKDRVVLTLMIVILLQVIGIIAYVAATLRPSELQLVSHYSAFGATHLYRDQWYYLLIFAFFPLAVGLLHISLMAKIFVTKGRSLTILIGWLGIAMMVFSWMTAYAIFNVWSPVS